MTWKLFKKSLKHNYLTKRYYGEKAKDFFNDLKLG